MQGSDDVNLLYFDIILYHLHLHTGSRSLNTARCTSAKTRKNTKQRRYCQENRHSSLLVSFPSRAFMETPAMQAMTKVDKRVVFLFFLYWEFLKDIEKHGTYNFCVAYTKCNPHYVRA